MLKVGELAARAGLTVRTLHHYDSIGLLIPSARSDAGYRSICMPNTCRRKSSTRCGGTSKPASANGRR